MLSAAGTLAVIALGALVALAWLFGIDALKGLAPGLATMKMNTACGFLLSGGALWCLRLQPSSGQINNLGRALAAIVVLIGGLTLLEYAGDFDLGIDQWLASDQPHSIGTSSPGRMSLATAFCFFVGGTGLLLLQRYRITAQLGIVVVNLVALLALIGYAYGVAAFYHIKPFSSMALHTAAGFWVLSLSTLLTPPLQGLTTIVAYDSAGGHLARRLLPLVPLSIFVLGYVCVFGVKTDQLDWPMALAMLVVSASIVCTALVVAQAKALHRIDLQRIDAMKDIEKLNIALERQVELRTAELRGALSQVDRLKGLLPICVCCKSVRDDRERWHSLEDYLIQRTDARFHHSVCPQCMAIATVPNISA